MSQQITIVDDLTGDEGAVPVRFAIEGKEYEIDLSPESYNRLAEFLAPYIEAGRLIDTEKQTKQRNYSRSSSRQQKLNALREWADDNGIALPQRGRIPARIEEAFDNGTTKELIEALDDEDGLS